ncbi:MAG TPA: polysaccharide deacetylase family protein [Candidatus Polarisedimenticolia bacterium]|jgi:peptidoglycan/xylan/chitin deacetylase (PgdA/CDA1 family)|nr:polysaccharide deacetylase family protein [Candidatus Polarisedimenticolia bacterium]
MSGEESFQLLLYHGIYGRRSELRGKPARESVSEEDFRRQVRWMMSQGYSILPLGECLRRMEGEGLPPRTVCLTFDDGKKSDLHRVAPILASEGVRGTFFIIPGWLGNPNIMGADEVRSLADLGMEIGSHSQTHPFMTSLTEPGLAAETALSKEFLEELVGKPVECFSYPYGDVDGRVRDAVARAGYRAACGTRRGGNSRGSDWLLLRRWGMHEGTGTDGLRRILELGVPTLLERGVDWAKRTAGLHRYTRWRERLMPKVKG